MVDFSASQHVPEPPRMSKESQFDEAEEEERTKKGDLEVLVQGESSQSIEDHTVGVQGETSNPFTPENIVVQYNEEKGLESMYKSEIPGQENKSVAYQGKKDISGGYHP